MKKPKSKHEVLAEAKRGAKRFKRSSLMSKTKHARNAERKEKRTMFDRKFNEYLSNLFGKAAS